jgi:type II secretory pathway component PulC
MCICLRRLRCQGRQSKGWLLDRQPSAWKMLGFKTGDKVLAINDIPIGINNSDIGFNLHQWRRTIITVERDGQEKVINLPEDFLGQVFR